METANATRPKTVGHTAEPWWSRGPRVEAYGHFTVAECGVGDKPLSKAGADAERIVACVNALDGIRNPAAIPALIEASRPIAATADTHFTDYPIGAEIHALAQALAALDAEPVA